MSSIYILRTASFLFSVTFENFPLPTDHQLIEIKNIRKCVWKYPALQEQWFSNFKVCENCLEGLWKHILLHPTHSFGFIGILVRLENLHFKPNPSWWKGWCWCSKDYTLKTSVIQEMTEPSELFGFLNLTAAQWGSQLQTSAESERMLFLWLIYFPYPTFSLNSKQYVASSGKQLILDTTYPERVCNVLFPLALLLLFYPVRLESNVWDILA